MFPLFDMIDTRKSLVGYFKNFNLQSKNQDTEAGKRIPLEHTSALFAECGGNEHRYHRFAVSEGHAS